MIDQGFGFNAVEWSFPDAPLSGLYTRHRVNESARDGLRNSASP
jgi:hypothetical protein